MKQVLDAKGLKRADTYSIEQWSISEIELMERAGRKLTEQFLANIKPRYDANIVVFCGKGNNAGDGLVMARLLAFSYPITVVLPGFTEDFSPSMQVNLERLQKLGSAVQWLRTSVSGEFTLPAFSNAIVLDALFGTGFKGKLSPPWTIYIEAIQALPWPIVAIDVPSGLNINQLTAESDNLLKASATLCVDRPPRCFMFPESFRFTGKWYVAPNVFHPDCRKIASGEFPEFGEEYFLELSDFIDLKEEITPFAHKGIRGHGLLIAGSVSMPGAAVLASEAAMRSGLGKLSVHTPYSVFHRILNYCPEAIWSVESEEDFVATFPEKLQNYRALAFGPGCGTEAKTTTLLKLLIQEVNCPLILDADGLNILSENPTWLSFLPASGTIMTPHPAEFDRLTETHYSSAERLESAKAYAKRYHIYLILKGPYTQIIFPDGRVFYNFHANNGLGKAGSGDVLTGILLGLLTRGYQAGQACLLGVMAHGLAAKLVAEEKSTEGMRAADLSSALARVWRN